MQTRSVVGARMRVTWLTIASLLAAAVVFAFSPPLTESPYYAGTLDDLRRMLGYAEASATFNALRGSLVADMLFLLAYGTLLRALARWHHAVNPAGRLAPWAARAAVVLMVCDGVENTSALAVLAVLRNGGGDGPWLTVMHVASVAKWIATAAVTGAMAWLSWRQPLETRAVRHWQRVALTVAFAVAALGALGAAIGFVVPTIAVMASRVAVLFAVGALSLQAWTLGLPSVMLRFLWLARASLGALLVIAAYGPLAIGPVRAFLGATLQLETPLRFAQFAACTMLASLVCGAQINLLRSYAALRFDDRRLFCLRNGALRDQVFGACVAVGLLPALSSLFSSPAESTATLASWIAATAAGAVGAVAFAAALEFVIARCADPRAARGTPFFVVPSLHIDGLAHRLRRALQRPRPRWAQRWLPSIAAVVQRYVVANAGPGYVDRRGPVPRLLPGHVLAVLSAVGTLAVYAAVVGSKLLLRPIGIAAVVGHPIEAMSSVADAAVPTITAVVLLVTLLSWAASALTFWLDRYRLPLVTGVLAIVLATGASPKSDHVFEVTASDQSYTERTPGEVLAAFGERPVLVAIAGGGIQAGAWGAEVLAQLDAAAFDRTLRSRVALVSAVSGGAMSALYFGAYHDDGLDNVRRASRLPSLDEVATTLVSLDVLRVIPGVVPRRMDRGRALERTWQARLPDGQTDDASRPTMRAWAERAGQPTATGRFPAFLFNTTVVDTGQPLAIATTVMPSAALRSTLEGQLSSRPVVTSFNTLFELYGDDERPRDVHLSMATAARLSATFPYVSPAAAPDWPAGSRSPRLHLVDGGYYDNYGLVGLSQWLDDALTEITLRHREDASRPAPPRSVEVLVVRLNDDEDRVTSADWGWAAQLPAPATAFLRTRTYGQWAGGSAAVKLLEEKWGGQTRICDVAFTYPVQALRVAHPVCGDPPLSWKLTQRNQWCVGRAWEASTRPLEALRAIEARIAEGADACPAPKTP